MGGPLCGLIGMSLITELHRPSFLIPVACGFQIRIADDRICTVSEIFLNAAYCSSAREGGELLKRNAGGRGKRQNSCMCWYLGNRADTSHDAQDSGFNLSLCHLLSIRKGRFDFGYTIQDSGRTSSGAPGAAPGCIAMAGAGVGNS